MQTPDFLRRKAASSYLQEKYGFAGGSTLAKLASAGGGPTYHKAGAAVLYTIEALDTWARARIGAAQRSTSDREGRS